MKDRPPVAHLPETDGQPHVLFEAPPLAPPAQRTVAVAKATWRPAVTLTLAISKTTGSCVHAKNASHDGERMTQESRTYEVRAIPGSMFIVGEHPTRLLNVGTFSDTLEMYPDVALLQDVARGRRIRAFAVAPTLATRRTHTLARDPVAPGLAHVFRRACMNRLAVPDVQASTLAHTPWSVVQR